MPAALPAPSGTGASIDLELRPSTVNAEIGDTVGIAVYAVSGNALRAGGNDPTLKR